MLPCITFVSPGCGSNGEFGVVCPVGPVGVGEAFVAGVACAEATSVEAPGADASGVADGLLETTESLLHPATSSIDAAMNTSSDLVIENLVYGFINIVPDSSSPDQLLAGSFLS
jgi:hypothetical protein